MGDTNHARPKVVHVHVEQQAAARVKTFGLGCLLMAAARVETFGLGCFLILTGFGGVCLHGELTIGGQQLQLAVNTVPSACV